MAAATTSKSDFVRDFLGSNPQANAKAVNEAWTAAGMKGTISHPVISHRAEATGADRQSASEDQQARQEDASPQEVQTRQEEGCPQGHQSSQDDARQNQLREGVPQRHPQGNAKAVNEAWEAAGFNGNDQPHARQQDESTDWTYRQPERRKTKKRGSPIEAAPRTWPTTAGSLRRPRQDRASVTRKLPARQSPWQRRSRESTAWQARGFAGTISPALVTTRREHALGLTGNLRGKTKKTRTAAKAKAPYHRSRN